MLRHYITRIDYRASTLTLLPPSQFRPPAEAKQLALSFDASGVPAVAAAVDGKRALFELDVRAPTSMLFSPFLARTGLHRTYARTPVVKQSRTMYSHPVHTVTMSGFGLHDVPFWFSTGKAGKFASSDVAGLLGNNVLSHFVVTIDLPHRRVYLTR